VRTKSIIVYPTKALANDQVNRIVEILYEVNKDSTPYQEITVGIITGDTPDRAFGGWKIKESPLVQLCPHCQSSNLDYPEYELQDGIKISGIKCKSCGSELAFVRLTREDILRSPPDILITNLDEINYCLQTPRFRSLFKQKIDIMVLMRSTSARVFLDVIQGTFLGDLKRQAGISHYMWELVPL